MDLTPVATLLWNLLLEADGSKVPSDIVTDRNIVLAFYSGLAIRGGDCGQFEGLLKKKIEALEFNLT